MSLTARVLLGLAAGFALGLLIPAIPALSGLPRFVEPFGTIWVSAIRMTVIPLVVSSLVIGVAAAPDAKAVGRLGGRAIAVFLLIVATSALIGVLVAPAALSLNSPNPEAVESLRAGRTAAQYLEQAKGVPSFADWLISLVPVNPIKAATDGAMLPLIVFSVLFGLALTRIDAARRTSLLTGIRGLQDASFVLVRWILMAAPFGVFALSVPLAAQLGISAAGAVAWYIIVVSAMCVVFMLLVLYPIAVLGGRIPFMTFARAALPVQAVAMSSRSSMGALPVMIEQFGGRLGMKDDITGFLLPFSASMFRAGAGIGITCGVCFLASLYGVTLSVAQLASVAMTTVLISFSIPGIPAGSIIAMVPVLLAANVPVEGVGILIGLDTIPDMFRTTTNATGTMAVASLLGGRDRTPPA